MTKVDEIKAAIKSLSEKDYSGLRTWFLERDWEQWDQQIAKDSASGKLDFLINEANDEKAKGKLSEL